MCNVCVACKKLLLIENESCQYSKTVSNKNEYKNSFSIANLIKERKKLFRNIEKIKKSKYVLSSIAFNKALLINKIYPKYLNFNSLKEGFLKL